MWFKSLLTDKGEMAKTGIIYNENCPVSSYGNIGIPETGYPIVYRYSSYAPDQFYMQVPDGWIIFKKFEKPTISEILLCAFQLFDKTTGEPKNKYVAWYYKVNHWYEQIAGTLPNTHKVQVYDIDLKLKYLTPNPNDNLAPYSTEDISSTVNISGQFTIEPFSNIDGVDARYIGLVCHFGDFNNKKILGITMSARNYLHLDDNRWVPDAGSSAAVGIFVYLDAFGDLTLDPKEKTDPNEEPPGSPGRQHEGGGMGDRDDHIDPVPIPPDPTISATDAGFVTLYNPTLAQLQAVGDEIYTDTVWEIIKNFIKSPDEYIVGLGIIPVQPVVGEAVHPKCGLFTFSTAMPVVIHEYVTVDCGTIPITEFYGSAFDYAGMTSIQLYLPYIGFRDIDVDGVMDHTLGVTYKVDVYNGNCVAFVTVDGNVHYTFSGNCMQQVPTASQSFDNSISNGIALAAAVVGAVATGGATAAEEAATGGAEMLAAGGEAAASEGAIASASSNAVIGSSMVNVMNSKPNVSRSGALGSSAGLMGVQYPYIVRKIPRQSWPDNYNDYAGYPCNMTLHIGSITGFFVVDSINLSSVPATEAEIAEILAFLKGGVIK